MKILIVYYSRSGNTRDIGVEIAKNFDTEIEEVIDMKDRERKIVGWLIAGKDASVKKLTKIKYEKNPFEYDLVIIGTPVWAWTVTPAIRTYLSENEFNNVAFFCTCGGQRGKVFEEMEKLSKKPIATFEMEDKEVKKHLFQKEVDEFCKNISNNR